LPEVKLSGNGKLENGIANTRPCLLCYERTRIVDGQQKTLRHQGRTTGAMHASQTRTQSYENKY
jgi:hypothetical protein